MGDVAKALRQLSDEGLFTVFEVADGIGDRRLAKAAASEILRRSELPVKAVHNLPWWLLWLPSWIWHQKPVGEGRGR
jgi:hypothetical protein